MTLNNIFLCHSSEDKPKVKELYNRLVADGFSPWIDEENLLPGQDWQLEIQSTVRKSAIIIVCLSNNSINKTGYIQKEIKYALDVADEQPEGTIFIIPLKLEECNVPERLRKWHWVNFFTESGYHRLTAALGARLSTLEKDISETKPFISPHLGNTDTLIDKKINYSVTIPLTLIGCFFGLVIEWGVMDTSSFSFMLCVFPLIVIATASIGWVFGGVISQSTLNPFLTLKSSRLSLGLIGCIFGFSIGLYAMRSTCDVASFGSIAYDACNYYSFNSVITVFSACAIPPMILGSVSGIIVANLAKRKNIKIYS